MNYTGEFAYKTGESNPC